MAITDVGLTVVLTSRTTHPLGHREMKAAHEPVPAEEPSREERRAVAWSQREAGWTNKEIADHFAVHPSTVGRWFADPPPESSNGDDRHDDRELTVTGAAGGGMQGAASSP